MSVMRHVTSPPPRVVRKRLLDEMDARERVAAAQAEKSRAAEHFLKRRDYGLALKTYASAVDERLRRLGMGIKGSAVATALSQVCGAILYGVAGHEGTAW